MEVSTKLFQHDLCNYFFETGTNLVMLLCFTYIGLKKRFNYVTELRNISAYLFMPVDLMNDP